VFIFAKKFYFMDFQIGLVIAGLIVGFIVGITGVGGGSLMTLFYYGLVFRQQPLSELTLLLLLLKWVVYMYIIKKIILINWLSLGSVLLCCDVDTEQPETNIPMPLCSQKTFCSQKTPALSITGATVTLTLIRCKLRCFVTLFFVSPFATPRLVGTEIAHAAINSSGWFRTCVHGKFRFRTIRAVNRVSSWNLYWKYVEWKSA
jgi:hypothetical protein